MPQQDADADTHLLRTALVADCDVLHRGELRQRPRRPGPRSLLICPMSSLADGALMGMAPPWTL